MLSCLDLYPEQRLIMTESAANRIAELPCWKHPVRIEPLSGGMTNLNFKITDGDECFVVRLGEDDPVHLISRRNEIASCEAAFAIGISPELVYHEPGILVVRFVEGHVFGEADVRDDDNLQRIVALLNCFTTKCRRASTRFRSCSGFSRYYATTTTCWRKVKAPTPDVYPNSHKSAANDGIMVTVNLTRIHDFRIILIVT